MKNIFLSDLIVPRVQTNWIVTKIRFAFFIFDYSVAKIVQTNKFVFISLTVQIVQLNRWDLAAQISKKIRPDYSNYTSSILTAKLFKLFNK